MERNDSNEIHFDIARCLYRNMCEKYCCPELCTVFCQSDITAFSGYEPKIRFERAGTLGEGADCCDFHLSTEVTKHIINHNHQRARR